MGSRNFGFVKYSSIHVAGSQKQLRSLRPYSQLSFYGSEVPIAGMAGDQQAALFGQMAFEKA